MRLLQWLFSRAPSHLDEPPPITPKDTDVPRAPMLRPDAPPTISNPDEEFDDEDWDDDDDDPIDRVAILAEYAESRAVRPSRNQTRGDALENVYCEIEYADAAGHVTRRPITMLSHKRTDKASYIHAICHMRKAQRSFRCDRIVNVISSDGEVFNGNLFLTEMLHLSLVDPVPSPARPARLPAITPVDPSRTFRDRIVSPLMVLVACGKSDGHFHPEEIDRVMSWAEREAMYLVREGEIDRDISIVEADALGKTVATMRPQRKTLARHMVATLSQSGPAKARFRNALAAVIRADGIVHSAETAFMAEFDHLAELSPDQLADVIARDGA